MSLSKFIGFLGCLATTIFVISYARNASGQTVASEALSIQCAKGQHTVTLRLEKSSDACKLTHSKGKKLKTLFEDKQSASGCESDFQNEIKKLRKMGYACE